MKSTLVLQQSSNVHVPQHSVVLEYLKRIATLTLSLYDGSDAGHGKLELSTPVPTNRASHHHHNQLACCCFPYTRFLLVTNLATHFDIV